MGLGASFIENTSNQVTEQPFDGFSVRIKLFGKLSREFIAAGSLALRKASWPAFVLKDEFRRYARPAA
jgi:hypothetical protein